VKQVYPLLVGHASGSRATKRSKGGQTVFRTQDIYEYLRAWDGLISVCMRIHTKRCVVHLVQNICFLMRGGNQKSCI
jgi:hypothetical protein